MCYACQMVPTCAEQSQRLRNSNLNVLSPPSSLNKKRNCLQIRNDPDASNTTRGRYITPKKIRDNQRDSQDKHQIQKRTTPPPSGQNRTPPISSSFTVIHPRYVLDVMTRKTDSCLRHVKTNKKNKGGKLFSNKKGRANFEFVLTLNDEVNNGVGTSAFVDQTRVLSVIVMADGEKEERVRLRVERHPVLIVPDDDRVVAVLDQFDGRRFAVRSSASRISRAVHRSQRRRRRRRRRRR